jgi:hypothetical protein
MKNLTYLFVIALLIISCKKEERMRMPVITGKVVDVITQKGVAGIDVRVVDFWTDGWNYSVYVTGSATTDSLGNFVVNYTVKEQDDDRILKFGNIPSSYQWGARINGEYETCVFYDLSNDYGELFNGYRVEDEGTYKVELMPANTFAYIVPPTVPSAWLADTIEMTTGSWYNPLDNNPFGLSCNILSTTIKFPIGDNTRWDTLSMPNRLKIGDRVTVGYRIYNGNVTKMQNFLEFQCHFNDTTAMALPF